MQGRVHARLHAPEETSLCKLPQLLYFDLLSSGSDLTRQMMSHSTNARLYPHMQPHRWPWPGLWAAGFPKQMEGPAKCLGGSPALLEPVPGAGITDVPPRQQSQHMPLLGRRWLGSDRTCTPRFTHQGISTVVFQGGLLGARLHPPPFPSPRPAWPILPPDLT